MPIARRLLDAGHALTVWNRTQGKAVPLIAGGASAAASPAEEMRELVQRYDSIREAMRSGPQRTREMTDVVRHLTVLADKLDDIDWRDYLISSDGGERLAAYSYYYERQ